MLFELNQFKRWRYLFGTQIEDARMSDLEFILRFFALSSNEIKNRNDGQISLKLFLNNYMGNKDHNSNNFIESKRNDFLTTINFIFENLGVNAFKNINNDNEYQSRFHPTIFDSISIATSYVLKKTEGNPDIQNLKSNHLELLKNSKYKEYTTIRTTNLENINGRIRLACQFLYNLNYE